MRKKLESLLLDAIDDYKNTKYSQYKRPKTYNRNGFHDYRNGNINKTCKISIQLTCGVCKKTKMKFFGLEGENSSEWILIDF